jgi:hypothetical protein
MTLIPSAIRYTIFATVVGLQLFALPDAHAEVQQFTNQTQWQSAAGSFTTITFGELPTPSYITNQYADLGVIFSTVQFNGQPGGTVYTYANPGFLNDGVGMSMSPSGTTKLVLSFAAPIQSIGTDYPGGLEISVYNGTNLIHTFLGPSSGLGNFMGLTTDAPFDRAVIWDPQGGTYIDDLHFGPPIPAPPVAPVLVFGFCAFAKRRKRS